MSAHEWAVTALHLSGAAIIFTCGVLFVERLRLDERIVLLLLIIFSPFIIDLFS